MTIKDQLRTWFPSLAGFVTARTPLQRKAFIFGMIGVFNTLVDLCVFAFVFNILGQEILSNVVSWFVAVTGSYVMNSFITFAAESGRQLKWRGYATFLASGIVGLVANTATLKIVSILLSPFFSQVLIPHLPPANVLIGKVFAIGVSFVVNFSMSHFVVFRRRPHAAQRAESGAPSI
jgi:putative flippase GtrA